MKQKNYWWNKKGTVIHYWWIIHMCVYTNRSIMPTLARMYLPVPADTIRWINVSLTLDHRQRRWTNVNPPLNQRLVSAGYMWPGGGGGGCHHRVVPPGQLLKKAKHTQTFHRTRFFYFFDVKFFCVCFPVVQGFSLRLLCLFSNSFQFKFFIYSFIYFFIVLVVPYSALTD